jgi:hypothetical protein
MEIGDHSILCDVPLACLTLRHEWKSPESSRIDTPKHAQLVVEYYRMALEDVGGCWSRPPNIYIYIIISQVAKEQLPKRVKRLSDSDVHVDGFEAYNPNKDHARSSR